MKKKFNVREMVFIAILGALSAVLMFLKFPLPFMPPFMSFDFSAVPEIVGAFLLGPIPAIFIILIKVLIMIVTMGSNSMFTGEIQNFILSCAFVLPAAIVYKKGKSRKSAILGMIAGTIVLTIVAIISNLYFIIPFYSKLYGISVDDMINMTAAVNPLITNKFTFALFGIVPFNLIKGIVSSVITILIYKKISVLFKKYAIK